LINGFAMHHQLGNANSKVVLLTRYHFTPKPNRISIAGNIYLRSDIQYWCLLATETQ